MSFKIAATIGSAIIGKKAADKSASAARDSAGIADDAAMAQLDFAKEQYEDWKAVFGDIQDNLSTYYRNLTHDSYAAEGLQTFTRENREVIKSLRGNLEQRCLATSGAAAQLESDWSMFSAEQRALIRAEAPKKAAAEKLRFLT